MSDFSIEEAADKAASVLGLSVHKIEKDFVTFANSVYLYPLPYNSVFQLSRVYYLIAAVKGVAEPFICGVGGNRDSMGLPEYLQVCPFTGLAGVALYKKTVEYSEPGY
jgi:hypothetical protein